MCIAPKFALVHPEIADRFTERLHRHVAGLRVGPPEDPDVVLSPVVKRAQCLEVMEEAVGLGARLICGGELVDVHDEPTPRGPFIRPVLLRADGLAPAAKMRAVREETFFPLMCVVVPEMAEATGRPEVRGGSRHRRLLDELIAFVNSNRYGLRNSLWARDPEVIERFCAEVTNGGVPKVNDSHIGTLPVLPMICGTGATGGVFGEANLAFVRTTRLQGISVAADPADPALFDHMAAAAAPPASGRRQPTASGEREERHSMTTLTGDGLLDRKIDVCFGHVDANGSGSVDREDLLTLGTRLLSAFGESPTSPKGTALMNGMVQFWDALSDAADADGDQRLTPEEYRAGMKGAFINSSDGFNAAFRPLQTHLDTHAWFAWSDPGSLPDPVEPPQLLSVLGALVSDGPWCDRHGG
ncbi:aldehyde dehydrogenase family protein [Streptomyces sp. NPDC048638]|uniref:aldehyde dehydrogenase family protein n=1 Tax=Streptomyces sp. NPDC048638 TaxID=3365580 RepID=UPI00371A7455